MLPAGAGAGAGAGGSDLAAGGVAEQFPFRVLHGAGDGAVHEPGHPELRHAQLALQDRVLDQGKAGGPATEEGSTSAVRAALAGIRRPGPIIEQHTQTLYEFQ